MSTPKPFKLGAKKSSRIKEKPDHNIYKNIESQFVSEDRRTLQEHTEIKKFVKKICEQI